VKNKAWLLMKHIETCFFFSFFETYNKRSSEDTVNQETWNPVYVKASLSSVAVSVFREKDWNFTTIMSLFT